MKSIPNAPWIWMSKKPGISKPFGGLLTRLKAGGPAAKSTS
jgi:hypothetical protein